MYSQRIVRTTLKLALLATLIVLAVSACGENQQVSEPRPLPEEPGQTQRPGEYRSEEFEPSLTFRLGQGWATYTPEEPDVLRIERGESGGWVSRI
jgi:hypothetical protein